MASLATTIIVQFIGLAVFSRQFGPVPGPLQALLPRVSETTVAHVHTAPKAGRGHTAVAEAPPVESHTAIILFPNEAYVTSHGWTRASFAKDDAWSYIRLDGDQLTFSDSSAARGANPRKTTPKPAAITAVTLTDEIHLPHLQECFSSKRLKKEYRPPEFSGAAAVFTFPEGVAQARACVKTTDPSSRTDTQVTIPLYGDLVISTTKGPKRDLILHGGGGKIIVGNIPTAVVNGGEASDSFGPHYEVYYEMGEGASGSSGSGFRCAMAGALGLCDGDPSIIRVAAPAGSTVAKYNPPPPQIFQLADFRCSNTQWP